MMKYVTFNFLDYNRQPAVWLESDIGESKILILIALKNNKQQKPSLAQVHIANLYSLVSKYTITINHINNKMNSPCAVKMVSDLTLYQKFFSEQLPYKGAGLVIENTGFLYGETVQRKYIQENNIDIISQPAPKAHVIITPINAPSTKAPFTTFFQQQPVNNIPPGIIHVQHSVFCFYFSALSYSKKLLWRPASNRGGVFLVDEPGLINQIFLDLHNCLASSKLVHPLKEKYKKEIIKKEFSNREPKRISLECKFEMLLSLFGEPEISAQQSIPFHSAPVKEVSPEGRDPEENRVNSLRNLLLPKLMKIIKEVLSGEHLLTFLKLMLDTSVEFEQIQQFLLFNGKKVQNFQYCGKAASTLRQYMRGNITFNLPTALSGINQQTLMIETCSFINEEKKRMEELLNSTIEIADEAEIDRVVNSSLNTRVDEYSLETPSSPKRKVESIPVIDAVPEKKETLNESEVDRVPNYLNTQTDEYSLEIPTSPKRKAESYSEEPEKRPRVDRMESPHATGGVPEKKEEKEEELLEVSGEFADSFVNSFFNI